MGAVSADRAVGVASPSWRIGRRTGSAGDFHARPLDASAGRLVELLEVDAPALVLGSTQAEPEIDPEVLRATNTSVVRRTSGGGAVLVVPDGGAWIDLTIGRDDALWDDDVARAFHWLGRAWVAALRDVGVDASMHAGRLVETPWSRQVCFAGLGPGEVVAGGRKLVGISQRRTRAGARFQCMVHHRWEPAMLLQLLGIGADLDGVATGLDVPAGEILDALLRALP